MKILQRYMGSTLVMSTLMVLSVVLALEIFVNFVGEMSHIGQGDYTVFQAFYYVILTMPFRIYSMFPMAAMIGVLMGLGSLASQSELIVMRAAGVSIAQITSFIMKTVILMIVIATMVGGLIAPPMLHYAETHKLSLTSAGQAISTRSGVWLRNGNMFIHIQAIAQDHLLQGITLYQFNDQHQLLSSSFAETAQIHHSYWSLQNITRSQISAKNVKTLHKDFEKIPISVSPSLLNSARIEPQEFTIVSLYKFVRDQQKNGLNASQYALVFWQRLFQPLATLVMILLAIPCIFGPLRSSSVGFRIVTGVAISFSFYLINQFFGPFTIVYQLSPILAAIIPSIIFAIAGIILMRRVR